MGDMPAEIVETRLRELGIAFTRYEHPPVPTVEEAVQHWSGIDAMHFKNLFVRNQKGNRHYLVVVEHLKRPDMRAIADQIGDGKLSFGSPERLMTHLGVTPGSVTPFGLINDTGQRVSVVLDGAMMEHPELNYHPLVNTMTTTIASSGLLRFIEATGHTPRIEAVSGLDVAG